MLLPSNLYDVDVASDFFFTIPWLLFRFDCNENERKIVQIMRFLGWSKRYAEPQPLARARFDWILPPIF